MAAGGLCRHLLKEQSALDQSRVTDCLRKAAELALPDGVVLLRQQPEVVAQRQETFEQARASSRRPVRARPSTSQKAHRKKVPSSPVRPSTPASPPQVGLRVVGRQEAVT
ncbi:hypothetical protein GCM10010330_57890 [Streptomyces tendae]|nr:hypothetical protein GCM10010330_57890 [Streptomyces tendae]